MSQDASVSLRIYHEESDTSYAKLHLISILREAAGRYIGSPGRQEAGLSNPTLTTLLKVSEALGVDLDESVLKK